MKEFLKQIFTELDNETFDLSRILAGLSILSGLGIQAYAVCWKGQAFDMQAFGVGTGALFAGLGVALGLKKEAGLEKK